MAYVTVNGKQYIVVDFPDDFVVPEGYQIVEMTLGSNTVQALKKIPEANVPAASQTETAAPADETAAPADTQETPEDEAEADSLRIVPQQRTMVMLNGYTEEVSPGLDSADPTDDLYYIYCLVDGKTQLYSYDSGEGTLQRASITVYHEVPTEPQTVIVYEPARADDPQPQAQTQQDEGQDLKGIGWNGLQIQMKVLLIALAVAIILIIILIIAFIAAGSRKRKTGRSRKKKQQDIPPRSGRSSENEDDDAFFSYVKTEQGGIDFDDLN